MVEYSKADIMRAVGDGVFFINLLLKNKPKEIWGFVIEQCSKKRYQFNHYKS